MRETIAQTADGLTVQVATEAPEGFFAVLQKTVWGTQGMLYIMHGLEDEVATFKNPYFITLCQKDKIIATLLVLKKRANNQGVYCDAYYMALLSVLPEMTNRGYAKRIVKEAIQYFASKSTEKCFFYAYVEEDNERSLRVFRRSGFQVIGDFFTPVYCKLYPKPDPRVALLEPKEESAMLERLNEYYKDFALVDFDESFDSGQYYVLKEDGQITAGLQVKAFHWTIVGLPGPLSRFILDILPKTPILNRLFNPVNYQFIKVGTPYMAEGRQDAFRSLLEALLNRYQVNSSMMYINTRHPYYKSISKASRCGLLGAIVNKAHIFAYNHSLSDEEFAKIQQLPLNVSMLDSI
jgi:RimJ/RimL family protein N-acetyltransferase